MSNRLPNEPVQITITLIGNQVHITGPINEKLLCYGLLEMAKEIISKQQPSAIVPATMPLPGKPS